MIETEEYLLGKIPNVYIVEANKDRKILELNDDETIGYLWDTKVRFWAINLELNHGWKLKYI